ncbi:hypothetical protein ACFWZ2_39940 [Streptomyces sp. NPDC059002]|uniref:hypothetical protein n=1 Tax=Streptomyces sp. NPDC059002 TaxID=3346690 RepID=UPI0036B3E990
MSIVVSKPGGRVADLRPYFDSVPDPRSRRGRWCSLTARLTTENQHLRNRLSEALGEQVWKETGLGGPTDIQQLQRRITELEQQAVGLCRQLSDRDNELAAARATNRGLMAHLNESAKGHREQQ